MIYYRLSAHERLADIALAHGVTTEAICAANPHKRTTILVGVGTVFEDMRAGEEISLPGLGAVSAVSGPLALQGPIDRHGPVVRVGLAGPEDREVKGLGILDSGGQFTTIDARVSETIRARVMGERSAVTSCGSCGMKRVKAQMRVDSAPLWEGVFETAPLPSPIIAIVGRDFLGQGVFVLDGPRRRWSFTS